MKTLYKMLLVKKSVHGYHITTGNWYCAKPGASLVLLDRNIPTICQMRREARLYHESVEILWVPEIFAFIWTMDLFVSGEYASEI